MNVGHILKNKAYAIHSVGADTRLPEAIKAMFECGCGSLVILQQGTLRGIITERDILWMANVHIHDFGTIKVGDIMTEKVVTCSPDCSIEEAMRLMTKNYPDKLLRYLPVMVKDQLVGVISLGDAIQTLLQETKFENRLLKHYIKKWPEEEQQEA